MKKLIWILCGMLVLLMPVCAEAASVGDVYAALRDIGVPEEYVSQAAGVLARGTSDGAGVYRSDGSYYAYSDMVGYIYANRETILAFCGVGAETAQTAITAGESAAVTVTSNVSANTETTTAETVTSTTTTAACTTTVSTNFSVSAEAIAETSAVNPEIEPYSRNLAPIAVICIVLGLSGFTGMILLLRRQERGHNAEH
ncbi:MAG: hypothetical protein J6Z40_09415 [Oscillospiraceae bacterium]|nr:hypothetical protein [Oscillospiraceae bacterium]